MSSNRSLAWLSLAAALIAAPFSLGCGGFGDVARTGCPAGETCSEATPSGLVFEGRAVGGLFFGGVAATAVGGIQHVTFRPVSASERLPASFRAETTEPGVLAITDRTGALLTLRGEANGSATVRVIDEADETLVDRLTLEARVVEGARLDALDLVIALAPDPAPVASLVGEQSLFLHLVAADGTVVVDEGMTLGAASGEYTLEGFDGIAVREATDTFGIDVVSTGRLFHAEALIVDAIDDLEVATWLLPETESGTTEVDATSLFCVVGRRGEARVAGGPGATFTVDGVAVVEEDESFPDNCITMPSHLDGATTTVTATLLGVTRSFTFPVGVRDASSSSLVSSGPVTFADLRPAARLLGDRALAPF